MITDDRMTTQFNTVDYCLRNNIPCFTFPMDYTKKISIKWSNITTLNFMNYINPSHNGIAILTGYTHFVIDFDEDKYNPPQEIKDTLIENCSAIEKTPGGYHFWFLIDKRTEHFQSGANISWSGKDIIGLDMRAQKGICYVSPSKYYKDNILKEYNWIKGNLSTATTINSLLLEKITNIDKLIGDVDNTTVETFKENDKITIKITPNTKVCLVQNDYIHSQVGHSCYYLTKLKTCFTCTANCFSHGKRKVDKEICNSLANQYWPNDENDVIHNDYDVIKESFEENNFKVLDPVGFYTFIIDKWVFRDRIQIKNAYENMLLSDGSSFIDKWLKDPHMKTYSRASFEPSINPSIFVFPEPALPSFIYTTYTCQPNNNVIPVFDELLDILTNRQASIKTYILNWLAHLLQKPMELPGVSLIFNGQKGAGKDTLGEFIGEFIIGIQYYQNYSNQSQYFDKHDVFKANKFLVKIEEINKKCLDNGVNSEYFKSSITTPILNFNPKTKSPYNLKNTMRVIATSNNSNPVDVAQKERRYVISVVSPEKIGKADYWSNIRSQLFNPEGALAIANILLQRDISNFNPRVLPENKYLEQLQEDTLDSVQKFIEQIESGEYSGSILYQQYKDYCELEGLQMYSNTKFSTQLLFFVENGSITRNITRKRSTHSIIYSIK